MTELTDKQARLVLLKKARDSGVLTVRHGEDMTTYRSIEEIERIIGALEAEILELDDPLSVPRRRVRYAYQSDKGL